MCCIADAIVVKKVSAAEDPEQELREIKAGMSGMKLGRLKKAADVRASLPKQSEQIVHRQISLELTDQGLEGQCITHGTTCQTRRQKIHLSI